ncbi:MAG: hypothetical protein HY232_01790 [Acidobacteria bacterium]|nr:hypothetical protein [Acidobacteriota bacterium]
MEKVCHRGRLVLIALIGFALIAGLGGSMGTVFAGGGAPLPDLVPMGFGNAVVTSRLGAPTLEFDILTANIGGQDFSRPRDPDTGSFLLQQIYEYRLYDVDGVEIEPSRTRKNTICTIDDGARGNVYPCIQDHGPQFTCSPFVQGISRGWADSYFRGLTGQWISLGDNRGSLRLQAILDPDGDLQRTDIPDSGRDATPDNNIFNVYFTYNGGASITVDRVELGFDPDAVCP